MELSVEKISNLLDWSSPGTQLGASALIYGAYTGFSVYHFRAFGPACLYT